MDRDVRCCRINKVEVIDHVALLVMLIHTSRVKRDLIQDISLLVTLLKYEEEHQI